MLEEVKPNPDDSGNSTGRSGVFRRIMARDLYDVTKRVEDLEQRVQGPVSRFLTSWVHVVLLLILAIFFVSRMVILDQRLDAIESQRQPDSPALQSEIDAQKSQIEELRQTVRAQSNSLRAMNASLASATAPSGPAATSAEGADSTPTRAPSAKQREPMPAFLRPGEVLLIIASTLTEEEAIDQARALEGDGHASEVILGLSGYYGVALGRFDFDKASSFKELIIASGAADEPYMINDETIDSYVYP